MKPMVTSSGRTPKRSVPCSAYHVVNVWNVSCSSSVATKIARMPGTAPRSGRPARHRRATGTSPRLAALPTTGRLAKPDGERHGDGEHGAGGDQEGRPHAQHPAQHQEHDRADAHLERDRAGGERAVARRHEVGDQRLERRSLQVDAGVAAAPSRAIRPASPNAADAGNSAMPGGGEDEARRARSAGGRGPRALARSDAAPGPGHQQEQQHVVDRHHGADRGAMVAERVAHQRRDERAEERAGDAGEEPAQADEASVRNGVRADCDGASSAIGAAAPVPTRVRVSMALTSSSPAAKNRANGDGAVMNRVVGSNREY